jgi:hypothetical protein
LRKTLRRRLLSPCRFLRLKAHPAIRLAARFAPATYTHLSGHFAYYGQRMMR